MANTHFARRLPAFLIYNTYAGLYNIIYMCRIIALHIHIRHYSIAEELLLQSGWTLNLFYRFYTMNWIST